MGRLLRDARVASFNPFSLPTGGMNEVGAGWLRPGHALALILAAQLSFAVVAPATPGPAAAPLPPDHSGISAPGKPGGEPKGVSPPLQATPPAPAAGVAHPLRVANTAFGAAVEVEVRDLPEEAAREAIQAAFGEIQEMERLTDPQGAGSGIAALNAAAGKGPLPADARLLETLAKAFDICVWSEGKHGPLGRDLYKLWGVRGPAAQVPAVPPAELVHEAANWTDCVRLTVDLRKGTAALAPGSGLDLWGFAEGAAVDRAVEILRQRGARNAQVRIGGVHRCMGGGPAGRGWSVELPAVAGLDAPAGRVLLRDQALAVATREDRPLQLAGETLAPYVDQRTGMPAGGVLATIAVTELALDAQALAVTLTITGAREGELRMGSIRPRPSILWFLGTGSGTPVMVDYRWSQVARR